MEIKKVNLVYFSPTGGTLKLARLMGRALGYECEEIDISSKAQERSFGEDELAVFAFPCYGGRIPAPMKDRMEKLRGSNTPSLLLCVFGNRAVDDAFAEMQDETRKRGFVSVAAAEFVAPHSVDKSYAATRPDAADMVVMDEFAEKLLKKLETMDKPEEILLPGNRPYVNYSGIPIKPSFKAKRCVSCGKCYEHCPTGAININEPGKLDKEKCISCMGCIEVCPEGARYLPKIMKLAAKTFLKKACSERKEAKYYI